MNMFYFFFSQILPSATGKVYPSISRIAFCNPDISLEGYMIAYPKCDFQIQHAKIYQNTNVQLASSFELEDIPASVSLRLLLSIMLRENGFLLAIFIADILWSTFLNKVKFGIVVQHLRENLNTKFQPFLRKWLNGVDDFTCNDPIPCLNCVSSSQLTLTNLH